jgi:hypothetical protein
MRESTATWVYAVVPRTPPVPLVGTTGVAGEPIRLLAHDDLAAVVGAIDARDADEEPMQRHLADPAWLERAARRHHHVVTACFGAVATVPFRIATIYRGDGRATDMLAQRRAELTEAMATVAGRAEWGVQAFTALPADQPEASPAADEVPARPGTTYLMRRRAQRSAAESVRRSAAGAADTLHTALQRRTVAAARTLPSSRPPAAGSDHGRMVLNAAYLVDDHRRDEFTDAVRDVGQHHPALRLRVTGPWPAYSFVEIAAGVPA